MNQMIKLSQAMSEKICHDLSGCATTIDNCIELVIANDNPNITAQAKELLIQESHNLIRFIKFFRNIYGLGGGDYKLAIDDLHQPIRSLLEHSHVTYNAFIASGVEEISVALYKTVNCLLSIASEKLSGPGALDLYISSNISNIRITGRGGYFAYNKEKTINVDHNDTTTLSVANVREYYINMLLHEYGYKISYVEEREFFEYSISKR